MIDDKPDGEEHGGQDNIPFAKGCPAEVIESDRPALQ